MYWKNNVEAFRYYLVLDILVYNNYYDKAEYCL